MTTPEKVEKVNIAPRTDQITAEINRENMSWKKGLGDMIDNSLDASATRVSITIDKRGKRVEVADNGDGCPEPGLMLQSGYTTKRNKRNMLGRYGVGLKHASFYFCGEKGRTNILTGSNGQFWEVGVVWAEVVASGAWEIMPPVEVSAEDAAPFIASKSGTCVTFAPVRIGFLTADQLESMLSEFSFVFSPALRSGKQIEIAIGDKRRTLAAPRDPVWAESIAFEVMVGHRKAVVRAGIKSPEDKSGRSGMSYGYGHRVIIADESDGMGSYSKEGFAGFVDLDEHWVLGQNKSSVTDDAWAELCEAILARIEPMLQKLKNSALSLQCEAIRIGVAEMLSDVTEKAKKPSGWHRKKGGPPKETGPTRNRRKSAGEFRLDFYTDPDDSRAGKVESNGRCVNLNRGRPMIAEAVACNNKPLIATIAVGLWANAQMQGGLPGITPSDARPYEDVMGDFLSTPVRLVASVTRAAAQ